MDPNANLLEMRQLATKIWQDDQQTSPEDAVRLAELIISLDDWIRRGGFLPNAWDVR